MRSPEASNAVTERPPTSSALLAVRDLSVAFPSRAGMLTAVREVSFDVRPGERVAVVGESGSGKSVTAASLMMLVPPPGILAGGEIEFKGHSLTAMSASQLRQVRGGGIGLISQDPFNALNPLRTVGGQIKETLKLHTDTPQGDLSDRTVELLRSVGLRDPERLMRQFPHELSGGMNQRTAIAMALAGEPDLLLADEPTTALDATTQAGILELLIRLSEEHDKSTLLITHDMGVVARFATRVLVMYAGEIVESGTVREIFGHSRHPYTRGLLASIPRVDRSCRTDVLRGTTPGLNEIPSGCSFHPRCDRGRDEAICAARDPRLLPIAGSSLHRSACHFAAELADREIDVAEDRVPHVVSCDASAGAPLLEVRGLAKSFPLPRRIFGPKTSVTSLTAVDGVDLRIDAGECVAVVGESGCGKSTLARMILGLTAPTEGTVHLRDADITALRGKPAREARQGIQAVFQDPGGSLDPQMRVGDSVAEPLSIRHAGSAGERKQRVEEMLVRVNLPRSAAAKWPHQFSGGQKQRIALARALVIDPELIVCDEPLTSLDVSVQAQILTLLREIQAERDIAYLFITHDLAVVRQIAQRVVVMYLGRIVESAEVASFFAAPAHPYSAALLDARPAPDPEEEQTREHIVLTGAVPSAYDPPTGCPFHSRCWKAKALDGPAICREVPPTLHELGDGRLAACHFPEVESAPLVDAAAGEQDA